MQVRLSLLAVAVTFNTANAQPLTQNCGSAVCRFQETVSCVDLMKDNVFTGTCCSLEDTEDGGCMVFVSAGICYWEPLTQCDGCPPGTGGKFLGSGSASVCPEATYNAIAPDEPEATSVPAAEEEDETEDADADEGDPVVAAEGPEGDISAASRTMGLATIIVASAATMLL